MNIVRIHQAVVFLLAAAFWVAGCPVDESRAAEIHFYQRGYVAGSEAAPTVLTDQAVAGFAKVHPEIKVTIIGVPWSREGDLKLRAVLLNREKIDVFRVTNDQLPAFIPKKGELLAPIDSQLTMEDRADIDPAALEALRNKGRIMAWPLWSTALHLIGNTEIMRQRGVTHPPDRPWNWGEFIAVLKQCTFVNERGTEVWGLTSPARPPLFEWSSLLWAHSGPIFKANGNATSDGGGTIEFTPGVETALLKVAELQELGVVPRSWGTDDQPAAQAQFISGSAAFIMSSPAFIRKLAAEKFPYVILPPPTGDFGSPITTGALGAFAVVDHPDDPARVGAAHAFARYLTSDDVARDCPGWYLAPPVRKSVKTFEANHDYDGLMPIVRTAVYMNSPGGAGFLEATIVPQLQSAVMGKVEPAEALENIRKEYARNQQF